MRPRPFSRRALLSGGALGLASVALSGCASEPTGPATPSAAPDPDAALLRELIAEKTSVIALYGQARAPGDELRPFVERHETHLAELRRRLTGGTAAPSSPAAAASPTPGGSPGEVSLSRLRDTERRSAAERPRQMAAVSPSLAQLIASIGACEAVHVSALSRLM
ncbi:hypothetical protein SAMN05421505_10257 [Sinosporangium album]|uniref:Ferritin-like domain-containing protein n=1 Tax=Sinosporangium album TaxID=504805 RepID=A0A1G7RV78_9ACTN|nr:hypothetical protein [Sinosporangium album]SDG14646.1 hypothetical protein SAMN05421505_10257 [Sinosporangium album]